MAHYCVLHWNSRRVRFDIEYDNNISDTYVYLIVAPKEREIVRKIAKRERLRSEVHATNESEKRAWGINERNCAEG